MSEKPVKYYSTNLRAPEVSFREALLRGLAPDGGLYMPSYIPKLSREELVNFRGKEYPEIALEVLWKFLEGEIDKRLLSSLCNDAYNFEIPIERIEDSVYFMRLDRGPTASFKDFAARMMARLMHHYISIIRSDLTILTATSGDTGSAVASAFHGFEDIKVIILFPAGEVTDIQRRQMTTLGDNITAVAVDGKFDDCQEMVKRAFRDPSLSDIPFSSANSINTGRLIPQSVYYFYAWSRLSESLNDKIIFSVPSGNFGNLTGGIIAREMGLPVERFVIASNSNNEVPEYLRTGNYRIIRPSVNCISSAMNVGHPSNMARIIAIYGGIMNEKGEIIREPDLERMRRDFFGISISENETREAMTECHIRYGVLLEPHGAVAWRALENYIRIHQDDFRVTCRAVSLETAHPSKFREEIEKTTGIAPDIPESLIRIYNYKESFIEIENNYEKLKELIKKL